MRTHDKIQLAFSSSQWLGVDFHDFLAKEQVLTDIELAEEFSVSVKTVKRLKKKMTR